MLFAKNNMHYRQWNWILGSCSRTPRNSSASQITQNHRMVGVGRDLCGSCSPTLLPKQGHLQ